jgi:soluble lytic murein transglycosylase-like protein
LNVRRSQRPKSAIAALAASGFLSLLCCQPARAAERLTLANGFDVICNHHALVDGRVRVYLKAETPDYFELRPESIAAVETVPDPPPAAAAPATIEVAEPAKPAAPAKPVRSSVDTRLTANDLHQMLAQAGSQHNVDADLLASVVKAESGGNARAVSRAGARGLMQLMPGTARQLGVADSFQPEQNIRGGTSYLDSLLTRYHDSIALALAAYNAGPEAVDRYHGIPPYHETRLYVARVIHEFNRRLAARKNLAAQASASAIPGGTAAKPTGPASEMEHE